MKSKIGFAGDVELSEISILSGNGLIQNILPQVEGIELYEDLFGYFISGKLIIKDAVSLKTFFPLVGDEFVRLDINTPSLPDEYKIKGEYFIYSCSEKKRINDRVDGYVLSFISKEAIVDINRRISKTFKGTPDSIISQILDEIGTNKLISLEPSPNSVAFISNWWTPKRAIKYTLEHSTSERGDPDLLFYEDRNGFKLRSLGQLVQNAPYQKFTISNYSRPLDTGINTYRDIHKDYQTILNIEFHTGFDYFTRIKNGYYDGETISFDPTTQRYFHSSNIREFEQDYHLNEFNPIAKKTPSTMDSYLKYIPQYYNAFEGFGDCSNYKTKVNRDTIISRLYDTTKLIIRVHGRTDYTVGQVVQIEIPKNTQITETDDSIDYLTSGKYLISSISHSINKQHHFCTIELLKDSYIKSVDESQAEKV